MDREEIREQRKQRIATIMRYLSIIMAIFYFVMGAVFAFTPLFADISQTVRYILGLVLFLYGGFRFYRAIKG